MPVEIERKFIVADPSWQEGADAGRIIVQGYLETSDAISVRVRLVDGTHATLTVKLPKSGLSRFEFEQAIAPHEAAALLDRCPGRIVEKVRHEVACNGMVWEVDRYLGANAGLVVAEVELDSERQLVDRPAWLGREVTGIDRYQNARLARDPYMSWSDRTESTDRTETADVFAGMAAE